MTNWTKSAVALVAAAVLSVNARAVTEGTIPAAERISGSVLTGALMGGPLAVLATIVSTLVEELCRMGPNPATPPSGGLPPEQLQALSGAHDIVGGFR
ncbi:MAG: hypothetical protein EXR09_06555 [Acetobacteraceae bacterium]|nr:hypothetical protein [Acetobacteraceae bacterium]